MRTGEDIAYLNKLAQNGTVLPIQAGKVAYIKISSNDEVKPTLTVVEEKEAQEALKNTQTQKHTLSHVKMQSNCASEPAPLSTVLHIQQ